MKKKSLPSRNGCKGLIVDRPPDLGLVSVDGDVEGGAQVAEDLALLLGEVAAGAKRGNNGGIRIKL